MYASADDLAPVPHTSHMTAASFDRADVRCRCTLHRQHHVYTLFNF
jgi:hypothetical protein